MIAKIATIALFSTLMAGPPPFMLEQTDSSGNGVGLCLQPPAGTSAVAGSFLVLRECNSNDTAQLWSWNGVAGSSPGQIIWEGVNPTLCLDIGSNPPTVGTNPTLETCSNAASQEWSNINGGSEWSISGSFCMDAAIEIINGRIVLVNCGQGLNETWKRN